MFIDIHMQHNQGGRGAVKYKVTGSLRISIKEKDGQGENEGRHSLPGRALHEELV